METGIQKRLTADPALQGLVATRVYPVLLPEEGDLPAITYQRISPGRMYTTTGAVTLSRVRLQIDFWGQTYADTVAMYKAALGCLDCFRGTLADGTYVDTIQLETAEDLFDSVSRLYRRSTDWIIFAAE